MALGLVARAAVSLSDHLNSIYRVLKGTDAESVYHRLPTAGSFEVRHSVTNAPVFQVTDAGMVGAINGGNIADGTVTTEELADGTIVNADVNAAANIAVTKLAHVGAGNVLRSNGTANVGGQVVNSDVAASAAIAYSKLNLAASITSNDIADQAIMNADVNNAAGIVVAKLGAGGTANRVVATADGTTVALQQVTDAMVGAAAGIAKSKLAALDIVNADVNASAAIAVTKIAHVGAGNVLKSNGTTANVAGQIVNADVAASAAIHGSKLADGSVDAIKLGSGITAPAVALLLTSGVLGAPAATIDFPGIPGTYKHLEIQLFGRSAGAGTTNQLRFQINSDATGAYHGESQQVFASSTSQVEHAPGSTDGMLGHVPASGAAAAMFGAYVISIPHYTDASNYTALISRGGYASSSLAGNVAMVSAFCMYYGPGAVTRIVLYPTAGNNWAAGTLAILYGLT